MALNQTTTELWQDAEKIFVHPFLKLGGLSVSIFSILYLIGFIVLLYFISNRFKRFLTGRLTTYRVHNPNVDTIISLGYYAILLIGTAIILNSAGLNLGALAVVGGAIGLGLGFGLQNIADNFISGMIIMFERPIKVGDRVDVGEVTGQVLRIGIRSTTVLTNDNISVIIPNSKFVSDQVINWTHSGEIIRLRIPVGVSYDSDPRQVLAVLQKVVTNSPSAHKDRKSDAILDSFGENSINFVLRVWTQDLAKRPGLLRHEINMAIWEAFKTEKIGIPFAQLDVHLKSVPAKELTDNLKI